MFPQYDAQSARQTILMRQSLDAQPVAQHIQDRIIEIFGESLTPDQAVSRIITDIRQAGDEALRHWAAILDSDPGENLRVPINDFQESLEQVDPSVLQAMQKSAERIEAFHRQQPLSSWLTNELGGTLGQLIRPVQRAGLYVPGGTAPLPSSVLMAAIPARVAGVHEIVVVSPAQKKTGRIAPIILAACAVVGVDEVYAVGGAQAIAALAYGTQSIPVVDKIVGPGNLFVTLAKRQVYGLVGIDGLAGPTETLVIADETAQPAWVAADLLAQAEHDILASAILITTSPELASSVQGAIVHQLEDLPRAAIVAAALENRSGVILVDNLEQAVSLANLYGPEHLCLSVADPWRWVEKIRNAGGIFLGEHSFEVLGDYVAGPSHVMPTGGSARFASPLNVWDFVHIISLIALDSETAGRISVPAAALARAEQLEAHARAALRRMNEH